MLNVVLLLFGLVGIATSAWEKNWLAATWALNFTLAHVYSMVWEGRL